MSTPYSANHVAGLIIDRCEINGEYLTAIKLQALLYFVQTQFILRDNTICIKDSIYAGPNGPYIKSVQKRLEKVPEGVIPYEELKKLFPYEKRMDPHSMSIMQSAVDPAASLGEKELLKTAAAQLPYKKALERDSKQIMVRDIRIFFRKPQLD